MTSKDVKGAGKRGRREKTRLTRRAIVDAAVRLFVERGYGATTLAEVADAAGVAVQTVYFHFGNKQAVLKEAVDVAAAGDDEPVAVLDRPWMEEIRAEPDPHRVIELWVRNGSDLFVRIAPIMGVVRDAASSDPEMAEQWRTNEEQRLTAFGVLADILADRGALAPGLSVADATDVLFALNSFEVFLLLTVTRGWSVSRWEQWLVTTMEATLLAQGHPRPPSSSF